METFKAAVATPPEGTACGTGKRADRSTPALNLPPSHTVLAANTMPGDGVAQELRVGWTVRTLLFPPLPRPGFIFSVLYDRQR
jgi:hypothetical protein